MDKLFLLKPGFIDNEMGEAGRTYYCPSCAAIEGVLAYYPQLREQLEIVYVDFPRPRQAIIDLIGEANQGCPVIVIDADRYITDNGSIRTFNGNWFINNLEDIKMYLAHTYQVSFPHP